jgi:hypothetical protein
MHKKTSKKISKTSKKTITKSRKKTIKKNKFLYNKNNSKTYDVYKNTNPKDTIHIHYKTIEEVKNTIHKLEKLYKSKHYEHKRISQIAMILKVRLEILNKYKHTKYKHSKHIYERYIIAKKYFDFLKERTKKKTFEERKNMTFTNF